MAEGGTGRAVCLKSTGRLGNEFSIHGSSWGVKAVNIQI